MGSFPSGCIPRAIQNPLDFNSSAELGAQEHLADPPKDAQGWPLQSGSVVQRLASQLGGGKAGAGMRNNAVESLPSSWTSILVGRPLVVNKQFGHFLANSVENQRTPVFEGGRGSGLLAPSTQPCGRTKERLSTVVG